MKKFKRILAYFLFINYATGGNYYDEKTGFDAWKLPENLCKVFWMTILSILLLPFTWQLFLVEMISFRRKTYKMRLKELREKGLAYVGTNDVFGMLVSFSSGVLTTTFSFMLVTSNPGIIYGFISNFHPVIQFIFYGIIGIVGILLIIGIIVLMIFFIMGIGDVFLERERKKEMKESKIKKRTKDLWGALTKRYCTKVTWDLKEEEK